MVPNRPNDGPYPRQKQYCRGCHFTRQLVTFVHAGSTSGAVPSSNSPSSTAATGRTAAGLVGGGLGSVVRELFSMGLAPSTLRSYRSACEVYSRFCREHKLKPYPASEEVMCLFVASRYKKGILGSSVKMYMAAIRYSQIAVGLGYPQMAD